ncbi:hypothetical protein AVEN_191658-1 [Araneus ventricosus]|uniref:Uncharacterized protein n=1 Tax=Araneus ventricosus TaxID=182803 RepID=A0A4Y2JTB2_ARAVE|nr:hypothetical protein AVEN_191658-1 [Araneus ventricosus]
MTCELTGGLGGLLVRSRKRDQRFETRFHRGSAVCGFLLHVKSYAVAKGPPAGVVRKLGEGVFDEMPSSSSDRGSKLRGPSLNSRHVASKREVNLTL